MKKQNLTTKAHAKSNDRRSVMGGELFYFISKGNFSICDLECCHKSDRTFDMPFYALANNENLLNKLKLYYMQGNYGASYTYDSRAKWFCGYLSAFCQNDNGQYNKSLANPTIRLLIEDDVLLDEVKTLLRPAEAKI